MECPPLGPGGEDITWPDQVAPRGRKASSTRKIKPQTSNRNGSLKHEYPASEWRLLPLGHWNWKWNQAGSNYSTYDQELLAGMLVLSWQSRLLGSNPIVWLCDQEPVKSFQKGPPPEGPKLKRWWTYLSLASFFVIFRKPKGTRGTM